MDGAKSIFSEKFSFVTFISKTDRKIDVFWLDYNGRRVKYGNLKRKGSALEMTTFVNHPWVFRDSDTGDKLVPSGGQEEVYWPTLWTGGATTNIYIDIPVYPLRERCLQMVRKMYSKEEMRTFVIPEVLKRDAASKESVPFDVYMYFTPDL